MHQKSFCQHSPYELGLKKKRKGKGTAITNVVSEHLSWGKFFVAVRVMCIFTSLPFLPHSYGVRRYSLRSESAEEGIHPANSVCVQP